MEYECMREGYQRKPTSNEESERRRKTHDTPISDPQTKALAEDRSFAL